MPCCDRMKQELEYKSVVSDGKIWLLLRRCTGCMNRQILFCPYCGAKLPSGDEKYIPVVMLGTVVPAVVIKV